MKFDTFYNRHRKEVRLLKNNFGGDPEIAKRNTNLWMVHQTIETNKKLIWATWSLAIVTIILSSLTIYFQYLK